MKNDGEYVPPVDAMVPYQSSIASFRRKLPEDEMIAFAISIMSPAESYATMIQRELESKPGYGITVTVTPLRNARTGEVETWRIYGVSKPLRVGDLSEDEHHAIAGWAFEVAGYFQSSAKKGSETNANRYQERLSPTPFGWGCRSGGGSIVAVPIAIE